MKMLTYPARPMNGGRFEFALPKVGTWFAEPKVNGWRALCHAPSGTLWNRHGEMLSISREFAPALAILKAAHFDWLDVEALERRHGYGRGTLLIIDLPGSALGYTLRKAMLAAVFPSLLDHCHADSVYTIPSFLGASALYAALKEENATTFKGAEFYEGIVMKKAESPYPRQLLSPERETPDWIKHRWKF